MKRTVVWMLVLPMLLAGVAAAADGDRSDSSRDRSRGDWREAMWKRMEESVKKFDKDNDGKLSESERRAMFDSFGSRAPQRPESPKPSTARREPTRERDWSRDSARRPAWPPRPERSSDSSDRRAPSRDSASRPSWPPRPQFGQFPRGPRGPWGMPMARGQFGRPQWPAPSTSEKRDSDKKDEAKRDGHRGGHAYRHHERGDRSRWQGHRDHQRRMARGDHDHGRRHGESHRKRGSDDKKSDARPERPERRPDGRRPDFRRYWNRSRA